MTLAMFLELLRPHLPSGIVLADGLSSSPVSQHTQMGWYLKSSTAHVHLLDTRPCSTSLEIWIGGHLTVITSAAQLANFVNALGQSSWFRRRLSMLQALDEQDVLVREEMGVYLFDEPPATVQEMELEQAMELEEIVSQ